MATKYVVLWSENGDGKWTEVGPFPARTPRKAVEEALETWRDTYDSGTYVAVPARSWKPVTVQVETKTALKFS